MMGQFNIIKVHVWAILELRLDFQHEFVPRFNKYSIYGPVGVQGPEKLIFRPFLGLFRVHRGINCLEIIKGLHLLALSRHHHHLALTVLFSIGKVKLMRNLERMRQRDIYIQNSAIYGAILRKTHSEVFYTVGKHLKCRDEFFRLFPRMSLFEIYIVLFINFFYILEIFFTYSRFWLWNVIKYCHLCYYKPSLIF